MSTTRRLLIAFFLDATLVVAEIAGGLIAHSAALVADAGHNTADVAALLLALVAHRYSLRAATTRGRSAITARRSSPHWPTWSCSCSS